MKRHIGIYALMLLVLAGCHSGEKKNAPQVEGMVYVPAGKFYMGSRGDIDRHGVDEGDGRVGLDVGVDELPRHTVGLKGFYMDKYEVTNARYKKFTDATGHRTPDNPTHPYDVYIWKNGTYPEGMEDYPAVLVNYEDALAYCKWTGKRLPAEEEWEKACRGEDGKKWPWGEGFDPTWTNTRDLELKRTSPVGAFPKDLSPYGVYDMGGNAREWTDSWYKPYPGSTLKRKAFGETARVLKGGSMLHTSIPDGRCPNRGMTSPEKVHRSLGFRCAKDGP